MILGQKIRTDFFLTTFILWINFSWCKMVKMNLCINLYEVNEFKGDDDANG